MTMEPQLLNSEDARETAGDGLMGRSNEDSQDSLDLELRLFGPMEVRVGGEPLSRLRSRKGLWVLAILALRKGRPVDRDWLAGTLWPDCDGPHSRLSLRQTLYDLRRALGRAARRLACDGPRTVRLDLAGAAVDVLDFDAAIRRGDPQSLETATQVYRGLLEDCSEDWAEEERRQREQVCIRALEQIAATALTIEDYGKAARSLRAALALDPYREDLLRSLMRCLTAESSPVAAMMAYREYRAMLGMNLAGKPSPETDALFKRLQDESRATSIRDAGVGAGAKPKLNEKQIDHPTLPVPLSPLIGRADDVRKVTSILSRSRLVTLTGTGGIGKTRLAIQAAKECSDSYPNGVVFVDLAPLTDPDMAPEAIRAALGLQADDSTLTSVEILCRRLAGLRLLLLMDNCEHLGSTCGYLVELLLRRCSKLTILSTSREVLGVKGETVWRVPSLAVPPTGSSRSLPAANIPPVSSFVTIASIRLFVERARAAEPAFQFTPKSAIAAAKICTRLDGIPLAIELAAARVNAIPVEKIAERLNDQFRLLLGQARGSLTGPLPRHQTLRASIDWSYDLLSAQEAALMRRLSVFTGGWTLEAAERVCSGGAVSEWEVLDLLTGLVEKSIVSYQPREDRYRMLETIRQYAVDRLHEEGTGSAVAGRFVTHYLTIAEEADSQLTGPRQVAWLDLLETEHDNLRAAMSIANAMAESGGGMPLADTRGDEEPIPDPGLRLATAMSHFWWVRGYLREGRGRLELALASGSKSGKNRARALNQAGTLAFRQADYAAARQKYDECLAINRETGDPASVASVLNNLGMVAYAGEEFATSERYYREALAIRRETGERWSIAASLNNLGTVAYSQQDYGSARSLYAESLEIRRGLGDSQGIAGSLNNLAAIALAQRDYSTARELQMESLPIRVELGDRQGIAASLEALAETEWQWLLDDDRAENVECDHMAASSAPPSVKAAVRAAHLLGAAEALRESIGAPMLSGEQEENQRLVSRLRELMDVEVMQKHWLRGRSMEMGQVVEMALDESRP